MKKLIGLLLLLFIIPWVEAQQIDHFKPKSPNVNTKLELIQNNRKGNKTQNKEPDYALYRSITHKFSWIVGVGDHITQEVANHLPYYFKLALKNKQGHWQHILAMHGDSLTSHHNLGTYILDPENDTSEENREWRDKLSLVCQWYLTSDISGEHVVEERAYDKDGYMVYGFQPIHNGHNRVVGSYINGYGYPVDIAESEDYTYGNVVMITYDKFGYDSIIDYLDGKGLRRFNNDGVDQRQNIYDSKGRLLQSTSNNAVGDYMIDNWGNCGNLYKYNDAENSYTITRIDSELKPMRMPTGRAGYLDTYIHCKVMLDHWGREKEKIFLDDKGNPDTTLQGIHRVVFEYSDNGILLNEKYFDLNEKPMEF